MRFSCSLFFYFFILVLLKKILLNFHLFVQFTIEFFHSKWRFVSELVFDLRFSFCFGVRKIYNKLFQSLDLSKKNRRFLVQFHYPYFDILGFCRLTLSQTLISFILLSIHPLETQKLCNLFRQFPNSFSLLLRVSRWLHYVQVNGL